MTWPRRSSLLLFAWLVLTPVLAAAQSWPRDVTGVPAPPCTYLSQTGALTTCSEADPLPMAPVAGLRTTDATAWGKQWFVAADSPSTNHDTALWEGDGTVTRLTAGSGSAAAISRSFDQGRTYVTTGTTTTALGFPLAFVKVSGVYVLSKETLGGIANNTIVRSTNLRVWTDTTGLPAGTSIGRQLAVQGTTIIAAVGGGFNGLCRSTNLAVSFTCVDTTLLGGVASNGLNLASPAADTWLAVTVNPGGPRNVLRSTDDGATWAVAATLATDAASTAGEGVTCLSGTICVVAAAGRIYRSTDAGLTWTQVNILPTTNRSLWGFVNFGQGIVQALGRPGSAAPDMDSGQRSVDFGATWAPSSILTSGASSCAVGNFEGYAVGAAYNGRAIAVCHFNSAGIADSEVLVSPVSGAPRFDSQGHQLVAQGAAAAAAGAWPTKLVDTGGVNVASVSAAGALKTDGSAITQPVSGTVTANQGAAAASTTAWPVATVQGAGLTNSQQVSAANTAVSKTITGVANQRAHLYRVDAFCSAGTSSLTITDGGTTIWSTPAGAVGTTEFTATWPVALSMTTGATGVITLGPCGAANTGTLIVQADQF